MLKEAVKNHRKTLVKASSFTKFTDSFNYKSLFDESNLK